MIRPHSQSITALGAKDSLLSPTVGAPCDKPVPGDDECTTIYPLGIHLRMCEFEIIGRFPVRFTTGCIGPFTVSPNSCFTFQNNSAPP